jgi:hypothetical protein
MADYYDCPSDNAGNISTDGCIALIIDEAKENRHLAFIAATDAGFYSP